MDRVWLGLARQIVNEDLASLLVRFRVLAQETHGLGRFRPTLNIAQRVAVCRHDFENVAGVQREDFLPGLDQRIWAILATYIQGFGGLKRFAHRPPSPEWRHARQRALTLRRAMVSR